MFDTHKSAPIKALIAKPFSHNKGMGELFFTPSQLKNIVVSLGELRQVFLVLIASINFLSSSSSAITSYSYFNLD